MFVIKREMLHNAFIGDSETQGKEIVSPKPNTMPHTAAGWHLMILHNTVDSEHTLHFFSLSWIHVTITISTANILFINGRYLCEGEVLECTWGKIHRSWEVWNNLEVKGKNGL